MRAVAAGQFDWGAHLRPGDRLMTGQATAEPATLTARLMEAPPPGPLRVFAGPTFSDTYDRPIPPGITVESYGAIGALWRVARAGRLAVHPLHFSALDADIRSGVLACDAVAIALRPALSGRGWNLGPARDVAFSAVARARVVVGELNPDLPACHGADVGDLPLAALVEAALPAPLVPVPRVGETDRLVAAQVAALVPDGAVIQTGVGAIPAAVMAALAGHRDLGYHSGSAPDGLADLVEAGVITNARKERDRGVSVTGILLGSERLMRWADRNPLLRMAGPEESHAVRVIAGLSRFHAINSALEVDLTGQIGAEVAGGRHLGAVGGQVDFARAARWSEGGRSIVALPSVTPRGESRIVPRAGIVTCARADADTVVTEHGAAELRGCDLDERARRMIAIAAPDHREALARAWADECRARLG